MKKCLLILVIIILIPCLSKAQIRFAGYNKFSDYLTSKVYIPPNPNGDWKYETGITTVDTGSTPLVSAWVSTNGVYMFTQAIEANRPVYSISNKGLIFDGVDDYLTLGDVLQLRTYDFILIVWFQTPNTAPAAYSSLLTHYVSSYNSWLLRFFSNDIYFWGEVGNILKTFYTDNNSLLSNNSWTMVSVVVKRDTFSKIYIGTNELSLSFSDIIPSDYDYNFAGNGLNIGRGYGSTQFLSGTINRVVIYIFDGQSGRLNAIPDNYEKIIKYYYNKGLR